MSKKVQRLVQQFQPVTYRLELEPNRDSMRLRGSVTIKGRKLGRPSQRFTFHQKDLKITNATITKHDKKGDTKISVARINHQRTLDEIRLHTKDLLYAGSYTVTMHFDGPVQDSMHGIYACNYEVNGQKQKIISTQFESHSGREGFPCIDEPEAKATFDLTLISPKDEACVSNTPIASQSEKDGKLLTIFETTPKMSTYLLAFVFGDLQSKSAKTGHGVETSIWATKAHKPEALDFALDVAVRALDFLTDYYGVDYPLAKCDHIAVPDFAASAMENWGLITYRESALVLDAASNSQAGRERISVVVAHELAHMWFGDLVTMKWWDDLWLNESFANVMEYVAVDALFPDWHIWEDFVATEGLLAIQRDCIAGVQSIATTVNHPSEIASLFDPSIVYAKGGRLLNMLMNYLGEDNFRRGLKLYFDKHAYANTTGSDLWQALSAASGKDVSGFMTPWLARSGFPLVEVTQTGTQLEIKQSHFLLDAGKASTARIWPVPLLANDSNLPDIFDAPGAKFELSSSDYVHLDKNAIGHYIVHYTRPEHRAALAEHAISKQLSAPERLMLLHDSSLLARAGKQSYADTLRLLDYYDGEDAGPVWDVVALMAREARRFVDIDAKLEPAIKAFVRKLIEQQYQRLGWEERSGESSHDSKLRATIIDLGIYGEHPDMLKAALARFDAYRTNPGSLPGELRTGVFGAAVRSQTDGAFEYLVQLHDETDDARLKDDITAALAATPAEREASRLLERLKDPGKIRPQDVRHWLRFLLNNRCARTTTWDWLRENWAWIEKTFAHDQTYDMFPRYAASAFSTVRLLSEYKAFFEPKQNQPALIRNIAMGVEEIENRVAWLERDLATVKKFFKVQ
jgi:aminopeptidase N